MMTVGRIIVLSVVLMWFGTSAYATDCNNGGRYEDNGDGTVTDCRGGLIWLKNATCTDTSNGIANATGVLTWYDALTWVAGLENALCGLTDKSYAGDWRLPTKTEWMAMVAYAKRFYTNPTLTNGAGTGHWTAGDVFTNVQSFSYYWSSTTYAPSTAFAWSVDMSDGYMNSIYENSNCFVWPVRGGQPGSFGSLFIE